MHSQMDAFHYIFQYRYIKTCNLHLLLFIIIVVHYFQLSFCCCINDFQQFTALQFKIQERLMSRTSTFVLIKTIKSDSRRIHEICKICICIASFYNISYCWLSANNMSITKRREVTLTPVNKTGHQLCPISKYPKRKSNRSGRC